MKIPLNSGAYEARGDIASALECINLIPEINPEDISPPAGMTHYPRPGLAPLSAPPAALGRGLFTSSDGKLFMCSGPTVYFVDDAFTANPIGTIADLTTPVSISDNGIDGVLVDGTAAGYQFPLAAPVLSPIVDGTGLFVGATRVDYADTFFAFNAPGTTEWYISLSQQVAFNVLNQANKTSSPDPIATHGFNLRQKWLLGTQRSEVWYLSGAPDFPYEEFPQTFIPYGCVAPYSLAQADDKLFWLSSNPQGQSIAVRTEGYGVVAISTRALEYEWSQYPTVADCISYSYQQAGHTIVVFVFPTANKSWGYDLATKQWHRRVWIDSDGVMNRERVAFVTLAYNKIVGQDWETGALYELSETTYTDNGSPIVFERSFPHVVDELKELTPIAFIADFETGDWTENVDAQIGLAVSRDGGTTYGNYRMKTLQTGKYRQLLRWRGIGMGRDFVFKLRWSIAGETALQGAFIDAVPHGA